MTVQYMDGSHDGDTADSTVGPSDGAASIGGAFSKRPRGPLPDSRWQAVSRLRDRSSAATTSNR